MPNTTLNNYTRAFTQNMEYELDKAREITNVFESNPLSGVTDSIKNAKGTMTAIGASYALAFSIGLISFLVIGGVKYNYDACIEMQKMATWVKNKNEITPLTEKLVTQLKEFYQKDIENNRSFHQSLVERITLNCKSFMKFRVVSSAERRAMRDAYRILKYMGDTPSPINPDDDLDQTERIKLLVASINPNLLSWESDEEDMLTSNMTQAVSGPAMVRLTQPQNNPPVLQAGLTSSPSPKMGNTPKSIC